MALGSDQSGNAIAVQPEGEDGRGRSDRPAGAVPQVLDDDLQPSVGFEQTPQPRAEDGKVVGDDEEDVRRGAGRILGSNGRVGISDQ